MADIKTGQPDLNRFLQANQEQAAAKSPGSVPQADASVLSDAQRQQLLTSLTTTDGLDASTAGKMSAYLQAMGATAGQPAPQGYAEPGQGLSAKIQDLVAEFTDPNSSALQSQLGLQTPVGAMASDQAVEMDSDGSAGLTADDGTGIDQLADDGDGTYVDSSDDSLGPYDIDPDDSTTGDDGLAATDGSDVDTDGDVDTDDDVDMDGDVHTDGDVDTDGDIDTDGDVDTDSNDVDSGESIDSDGNLITDDGSDDTDTVDSEAGTGIAGGATTDDDSGMTAGNQPSTTNSGSTTATDNSGIDSSQTLSSASTSGATVDASAKQQGCEQVQWSSKAGLQLLEQMYGDNTSTRGNTDFANYMNNVQTGQDFGTKASGPDATRMGYAQMSDDQLKNAAAALDSSGVKLFQKGNDILVFDPANNGGGAFDAFGGKVSTPNAFYPSDKTRSATQGISFGWAGLQVTTDTTGQTGYPAVIKISAASGNAASNGSQTAPSGSDSAFNRSNTLIK